MKQLLDPEAIIRSLEIALSKPFDYSAATRRLNGSLSKIPPGTLHIKKYRQYYRFVEFADGKQICLRKTSSRVYELARRRYCGLLLHALKCHGNQLDVSKDSHKESINSLASFIRLLAAANMDVARVVLTSRQYEWYTRPFRQKPNNVEPALFTEGKIRVRSKSEKEIGNAFEAFAVPYHFEEVLRINVRELVDSLAASLHLRPVNGSLFHYMNRLCYWNVPSELDWMNSSGSLWLTYDTNSGYVTIYPDFRIMLADGSLIFWEHEGLVLDFNYRNNATEREIVMKYAADIPASHLIATYEKDTLDSMRLGEIIKNEVLPYLFW